MLNHPETKITEVVLSVYHKGKFIDSIRRRPRNGRVFYKGRYHTLCMSGVLTF